MSLSRNSVSNLESGLARELSNSTNSSKNSRRASTGGDYKTPLPWLQGVWRGKGKGIYPTIRDFEYNEEMIISGDVTNPRPVLHYKQRTWSTHTVPRLMHEESGFIRVLATHPSGPRVEWVVSAPNGVQTIEEGALVEDEHVLHMRSLTVGKSSTARPPYVVEFTRDYHVDTSVSPPVLHYTMDMSTTTTPNITRHLECRLTKVGIAPQPSMISQQHAYSTPTTMAVLSQPQLSPMPARPSQLSPRRSLGPCSAPVVVPTAKGQSAPNPLLALGREETSPTASPVRQCPMTML